MASDKMLTDLIENMVECQTKNAEAITSLKDAISENTQVVRELNKHFSNGFKSEIKEHVVSEIKVVREDMQNISRKLSIIVGRPFWAKLVASIIVVVGGILTATGAVVSWKIDEAIRNKTPEYILQTPTDNHLDNHVTSRPASEP